MMVMAEGRIWRISGPLVIAEGMKGSMVYEVVEVGEERLIGEIIGLEGEKAIIQVYEDTTGLTLGEPVRGTGNPLVAELGPGLVGSIAPYLGEVSWRDGGWQVKLTERDSGRFVFLPGIDPHDSRLVPVPTAYAFYPDSLGHRLDPIFGSSSPASPSGSPGR